MRTEPSGERSTGSVRVPAGLRVLHGMPRRLGASIMVTSVLVAGCGGDDDDYANNPRPPAPIVVTAAIGPEGVSVSPSRFGAGPIELKVANLTDVNQRVRLSGSGGGDGRRTGQISPRETASLKVDVQPGDLEVAVEVTGIKPAKVTVGPERPSAQNDLLQP